MVQIAPFKGIRYSREKIDNLEPVVAPPYDVISNKARDRYYANHDHNVIRLILGKEFPGDDKKNNRYTRAREYFEGWLGEGILRQDPKPSIYVYEQRYLHRGERKILRGFIALAQLEEFDKGVILPHEETLSKSIEDRLELMRQCKVNFSSIFTIYSDPHRVIDRHIERGTKTKPVIDIVDEEGIRHRLWAIDNKEIIKKVAKGMEDKTLFIADGHHRYMTALKYRDEMRKKSGGYSGTEAYDYAMMYFTNMDDKGITILPAHRVIRNIPRFDIVKLIEKIREYFNIEIFEFDKGNEVTQRKRMLEQMEINGMLGHAFGMYCKDNRYYLLTLKDEGVMDELVNNTKSKEWKRLDVTILHALLIDHILGIETKENENDIAYIIDAERAIQLVDRKRYQLAFFLNPTKVGQVRDIAMAGEKMPGKATYFYPKLLTGLVMNKI